LIVWIVFALLIGLCVGHPLGFREAKRELIPLYKAEIERLEKWNAFLIKSCLPYEIKTRSFYHNKRGQEAK
jgi:hypothetical protein